MSTFRAPESSAADADASSGRSDEAGGIADSIAERAAEKVVALPRHANAPVDDSSPHSFRDLPRAWQFLFAGIAWLVAGYALAPSSHVYETGLRLALWLPALYLIYQHRGQVLRFFFTPVGLTAVALTVWSALSLNWSLTDSKDSEARELMYTWLTILPLALAARLYPDKVLAALRLAALPAALMLGAGLAAFFTSDITEAYGLWFIHNRATGLWNLDHASNAGRFAGVLVIALAAIYLREPRWTLPTFGAMAILLTMIVFSWNRSIWGALPVALIPLFADRISRRGWAILAGAAVVACVVFSDQLLARGLSLRPQIWAGALELWRGAPWQGLGLNSYYQIFLTDSLFRTNAHNLFLHVAVTLGVVGVTAFAGLWLLSGRALWQAREQTLSRMGLCLWLFSSMIFLIDGPKLWGKPDDLWLMVWLPVALALASQWQPALRTENDVLLSYLKDKEKSRGKSSVYWALHESLRGLIARRHLTDVRPIRKTCDVLVIYPSEKAFDIGRMHQFVDALRNEGLQVQETITPSNRDVRKKRMLSMPPEQVPWPLYWSAAQAAYLLECFRPKVIISERNHWLPSTFLRRYCGPRCTTLHLSHGVIAGHSSRHSYFDYDYYAVFGRSSLQFLRNVSPSYGDSRVFFAGPYFPLPTHAAINHHSNTILLIGSNPRDEECPVYRESIEVALAWLRERPNHRLVVKPHPRSNGELWRKAASGNTQVRILPGNMPLAAALEGISTVWSSQTTALIDCACARLPLVTLGWDNASTRAAGIASARTLAELDEAMESIRADLDKHVSASLHYTRPHVETPESGFRSLVEATRELCAGKPPAGHLVRGTVSL